MQKVSSYPIFYSLTLLLLLSSLFNGCGNKKNDAYESYQTIPDFKWYYDNKLSFEVSIPDTQSRYNMYLIIRHNNNYPFSNLWFKLHTQTPSGEKRQKRVEVTLARKNGKWYGAGLGGVWEVLLPIKEKTKFNEKGLYTFTIEQHMRKNPLPAIMDVGLRIERISKSLTLQK